MTDTAVGEKSFGIVCDRGCDLTPAQLGRLGVALVPHHVNTGQQSWLERVGVSDDDALERMAVRGTDAWWRRLDRTSFSPRTSVLLTRDARP